MAGPVLVSGQSNSGSSATTTVTVTLASAITAGNMLVAVATTDDTTAPGTTAISDTTGSNVWTRLVFNNGTGSGSSAACGCAIFVCLNAAAGSYGIKFTNGTAFIALSVSEFSPNGQSGTDGTNSANSLATGTPNPGAITTTNADDSIFGGAVDAAAATTWSAGTGYTLLSSVNSNANTNVGAQYQSFSAIVTSQSTAFGNSATTSWTACAAAVMAAAATGAFPVVSDVGQEAVMAIWDWAGNIY